MIEIRVVDEGTDDETREVEDGIVGNVHNGYLWLTYREGKPVVQMTETGRLYVERMMKRGEIK